MAKTYEALEALKRAEAEREARTKKESDPKMEKAAAIAKLRETIETAQKILEANRIEDEKDDALIESLRRKLAEVQGKTAEIPAPEAEPAPPEDKNTKDRKQLEEDRKQNPFKYRLIDNLHPTNFRVLFSANKEEFDLKTLKEIDRVMSQNGKELSFWNRYNSIGNYTNHATNSSSNGFYLRLKNIKEAPRDETGVIQLADPKAKYELYHPDGSLEADDLDFKTGMDLLNEKAEEYQTQQIDQFYSEIELREVESLTSVEEKREFLERKRKEQINDIKKVVFDIKYHTERLTTEYIWEKERAREYLEAVNTSKLLEYYTKELNYYKENPESYPETRSNRKEVEITINQINAINARYDTLLAGLEKQHTV